MCRLNPWQCWVPRRLRMALLRLGRSIEASYVFFALIFCPTELFIEITLEIMCTPPV